MTTADARTQDARRVLDVSPLPRCVFGHQGLIWWGTAGFMVIEGSMFVIVLIVFILLDDLRWGITDTPTAAPAAANW